jgi:hypothetical protein
MIDHIQWIVLGVFALTFLLLAQLRELLRQIARTAEEWRRTREALAPEDKPGRRLDGSAKVRRDSESDSGPEESWPERR